MARYSGAVGVRLAPVEVEPGIYKEGISEIEVKGDIFLKGTRWTQGELSQDTVRANHVVSFVTPESSVHDFTEVLYVIWQGMKWTVTTIQYVRPRMNLTLGGVYNG